MTEETLVHEARDHILEARWTGKPVRVTFNGQGGTACAERMVSVGAPYGVLCTAERDGFTFLGWHDTAGSTANRIDATTLVSIPHAHTLFAHWAPSVPAEPPASEPPGP